MYVVIVVAIKISMTEYHNWINCQAHHLFWTQQSMGREEYDKSGHLSIFTSLKHLKALVNIVVDRFKKK